MRPARLCPERRTSSRSRSVCGEPPVTDRLRSAKARSVAGPDEPVGREAHAALEAAHGLLGVGAEEAVHPLRAEPEGQQPLLQRGHVVALQQVPRSV